MRFPIPMAQKLGKITAEYRWFAVVYIVSAFFLIPLIVFALSLAGW
jgi:sodium-dependent phosphate cotransporter